MASSYPGGYDSLPNPTSSDPQDSAGDLRHDVQHANANDAIEAIQAELGLNPSGAYATVAARFAALGGSSTILNALDYGVVADATAKTFSVTNGSPNITGTGFTAADTGKTVVLTKAGGSGITTHTATYVNATTLSVSPAPTATNASCAGLIGTDNKSAIDAMLAAASPRSTLFFPAGEYYSTGGHDITKQRLRILGEGTYDYGTKFWMSSLTGYFWRTNVDSAYTTYQGFGVSHVTHLTPTAQGPVAPTAGFAIGHNPVYVDWGGITIREVSVGGFYRGMDFQGLQGVNIAHSGAGGCVESAIYFNSANGDSGTYFVTDSLIGGTGADWLGWNYPTHGIRWDGGGGVWIKGNHFWGTSNPVKLNCPGSPSFGTGNIIVSNNSFEDWTNSAIQVYVAAGTPDLAYISITGNVMSSVRTAGTGPAIWLNCADYPSGHARSGGNYGIFRASVVGNGIYNAGSQGAIGFTRVANSSCVGNSGHTPTLTGCTGIEV